MSHFAVFTVDGVEYDVNVMKLSRNAKVTDTDNSGRTLEGVNLWGYDDNLKLKFVAMEPQRRR